MGILSGEQYDEMLSRMEAVASDEEVPEIEAQADETPESDDSPDSNQEEDGSSADAADVKEEVETKGDDEEPDAPKVPESVPYGRFKEVNEKFRSRERDLERAQQRIESLEQMTLQQQAQQAPQQSRSADEWLDDLLDSGDAPETAELKALKSEIESVRSWQTERTHQLVSEQLNAEITAAVEKHPEVSKQELWQAVAADGTVDVGAVAAHIDNGREQLRSQYTAEAQKEVEELKAKLAELEKSATGAKAFRRPGSSTAAPPPSEGDRPRTVAEATAAFAEAIRERMSL
jgi:hypothetical protein